MKKFEVHVYFDVEVGRSVRFEFFVFAESPDDADAAVRHMYHLDDAHSVYAWAVDQ